MITEEKLEKLSISWFKFTGYESACGADIIAENCTPERSDNSQVVLYDRLLKQLEIINQHIPVATLESVAQKISGPEVSSIISNNTAFHEILLNGIEVEYEKNSAGGKSELKTDYAKLIDFSQINNNQFLVVNQCAIAGSKSDLYADIVVFINGLPLAVIELEVATGGSAGVPADFSRAYQKLQICKEQVAGLFLFNEALLVSDGVTANVGALTSSKNAFISRQMRSVNEGRTQSEFYLETLIKHFFKPALLLDYIYYSIAFGRDSSVLNKSRSIERMDKIADCFPLHTTREIAQDFISEFSDGFADKLSETDEAGQYDVVVHPLSAELENESIRARAPESKVGSSADKSTSHAGAFYADMADATEPWSEKRAQDPRHVPLWYATNRLPVNAKALNKGFSAQWSKHTSLGSCTVNIPDGHIPGSTGSSWWVRLVKGDDRLAVVSMESLSDKNYWSKLNAAMQDKPDDNKSKSALFFLHGYNVDFNQAAIRTAQLAYDLKIHPAVFFSWPSAGDVDGYAADEASIEASYDAIVSYISQLDQCALAAGSVLHVMAHSMGNRALLKALEAIASGMTGGGVSGRTSIDKLVFAAPDVDARVFMQSLDKIVSLDVYKTLYASQKDKVVWMSKLIHKYARAGFLPPVTIADGVDTIDASGVDAAFLGHAYVASARALLHDLSSLLKSGLHPSERVGLELKQTDEGKIYWRIN